MYQQRIPFAWGSFNATISASVGGVVWVVDDTRLHDGCNAGIGRVRLSFVTASQNDGLFLILLSRYAFTADTNSSASYSSLTIDCYPRDASELNIGEFRIQFIWHDAGNYMVSLWSKGCLPIPTENIGCYEDEFYVAIRGILTNTRQLAPSLASSPCFCL